ncbi:MAG: hypothetical protein L0Y72_08010 [Gemmataceae bacterium]|nr:hypothetical protein [Gemmataceae bacterium]MCI0738972.1 hypothetical protein [Gemmataceae bacterium]
MQGARVVQEQVLSKVDSEKLSAFVVWLPFVDGDSREKAAEAMKVLTDKRATHFWDARSEIGKAFAEHIKAPKGQKLLVAWDYYALFEAGAKWKDSPPAPVEWMHQLEGIEPGRLLDGDKLRQAVEKLLTTVRK